MKSLATKYRPVTFDDCVEQDGISVILQNQLSTNTLRGAYCFTGPAGTGKTTFARIFAREINHGHGNPVEIDAASHNGVDDVREIQKMAQTRSMDSEYKVFIWDEAHQFSAGAWSAMLKLIEEPPAKSIFILCTTDYWKIPKTIQSRCQRFSFKKISTDAIADRLDHIALKEADESAAIDKDALYFIAKQSDGCLRDAIVQLDKCLAYSPDITMENVLRALEMSSYDKFIELTNAILRSEKSDIVKVIEDVYNDGQDMKQFIKQYLNFILDVSKYIICNSSFKYTQLPETDEMKSAIYDWYYDDEFADVLDLLKKLVELDSDLKYAPSPKVLIEARLLV